MTTRIAISFFCLVLFFQLSTLTPHVPVPAISYGELSSVLDKQEITRSPRVLDAILTGGSVPTEYDSVVFVGDVMLGRNVEVLMNRYGEEYPYQGITLSSLGNTPAIVGNFEASMPYTHQPTPALAMRFSVDERYLPALYSAGFTHLSLANNHSLDYGQEGYEYASEALSRAGFKSFGHNTTIAKHSLSYIDTARGAIALIGINASQRIPEEEEMKQVLALAKRHSNFQVVYIHWGDEYQTTHSETQEIIARMLVKAGADLIVGHHPHVVQDIGLIQGVPVIYSLGNYVFDQYFDEEVQTGLVLVLHVEESPVLELIPVSSAEMKSQPARLDPAGEQEFFNLLAEEGHPSLQPYLLQGKIPLLGTVATSTKMAMMVQ